MSNIEACISLQTTHLISTTYINQNFKVNNVNYKHLLNLFHMICEIFQKLASTELENFTNFEIPFIACHYENNNYVIQINSKFQEITIFDRLSVPIYRIAGFKVFPISCIETPPSIQLR